MPKDFFKRYSIDRILLSGLIIFFIVITLFENLKAILPPFLVGFIGAYVLNYPVEFLEKKAYLSRSLAVLFVFVCMMFIFVAFTLIALPYLQAKFISFVQSVPSSVENMVHFLTSWVDLITEKFGMKNDFSITDHLEKYMGDILEWGVQIIINVIGSGFLLVNVASFFILTPIILFFLLKDWPKFTDFVYNFLSDSYKPLFVYTSAQVRKMLCGYVKGQAIICIILVMLYTIALKSVSLPGAFWIALLTGCGAIIPFLGFLMGFFVAMSVAFSNFDSLWNIFLVFSVYATIPLIEVNYLAPRFIGKRIGLHPVLLLFSVLAFGKWFGFFGVVFALPMAAILSAVIRSFYLFTQNKENFAKT
ncbi:MAG: AI-2E family transporter [Alphaproteobacteria bacterium]